MTDFDRLNDRISLVDIDCHRLINELQQNIIDIHEMHKEREETLSKQINKLTTWTDQIATAYNYLTTRVASLEKTQNQSSFVVVDPCHPKTDPQESPEVVKQTAASSVTLDCLRDNDAQFQRASKQFDEWFSSVAPHVPSSIIVEGPSAVVRFVARCTFIDGWLMGNNDDRVSE